MTRLPDYDRYDALALAGLVRNGELTAAELLEEAIARAEELDPVLNAIVTPAFDLGRRTAADPPPGPFAGVPFLLKDLLQPLAGTRMTGGSAALREYIPPVDSHLVTRFRRAGLVIFGKTNVPEFGLVATTEPSAYGATRNPWALGRSAGGSSGGAAAAVAAGIVPMAGANDGGGSIRIPAAWCGLFGLKPSRGRVGVGPVYSEVWGGAVADLVVSRSVRDSAAMLDAIIGPAPGDPYHSAPPERPFLEELRIDPGRLRIGFSIRSPIGREVDPECQRAVVEAAKLLESLGHQVEEAEPEVDGLEVARAYLNLYFGEVAAELRWLEATVGRRKARSEIEETTRLIGMIGESMPAAEYVASRRRWNGFARAMGEFHATYDLYMTPATAALPVPLGSLAESGLERLALQAVNRLRAGGLVRATGIAERIALDNLAPVPFTQLANLTGQPAMSVPLHWTADGLPCGVHFVAPMAGESTLYRLAARLEEARPWFDRRPPLVHA